MKMQVLFSCPDRDAIPNVIERKKKQDFKIHGERQVETRPVPYIWWGRQGACL